MLIVKNRLWGSLEVQKRLNIKLLIAIVQFRTLQEILICQVVELLINNKTSEDSGSTDTGILSLNMLHIKSIPPYLLNPVH